MRGNLDKLLPLSLVLALAGCGEKTKDEKMEAMALPLYEQMLEKKQYCKALEVTRKRFDYILDRQTSNEELNEKFREWTKRADAVALDCKKELWPQQEANLRAEIRRKAAEHKKYEELTKFTAFIPKASFGRDEMHRDCAYDVVMKNATPYPVMGFFYAMANPDKPGGFDGASYQKNGGYPGDGEKVIAVGEERRIRTCDFSIGAADSPARQSELDIIPLEVSSVYLESGEEIDLSRYREKSDGYDFLKDIGELEKRLIAENPNRSG